MNRTPAPPFAAIAASTAGCGGGEANTLPTAAASAKPLPTKPKKVGSCPDPPPMTRATFPDRGPCRAITARGEPSGRQSLSPWAANIPSSISSTTSAPALISFCVGCSPISPLLDPANLCPGLTVLGSRIRRRTIAQRYADVSGIGSHRRRSRFNRAPARCRSRAA